MLPQFFLVYWYVNDFLFHDDDDDLPKGSELRKTVAGNMMEVEPDFKKKKSNGEDMTHTKVKEWVSPYVMTEFEDHNEQKNLMVVVALPTGVMHFNTTNTDIAVGSTQEELFIRIIWPHNMTDVKLLLSQFMMSWHREETNIRKQLALEKAFNQLKEKATDLMWSKLRIPLPFQVQSKLNLDFIFITTTDSMH